MFKLNFERENYLISRPAALRIPLRHNSEDRNLRHCTLCHINEAGDEFHYVFKCPVFAEQRMALLGKRIFTHLSIFTFNHVMNASGTNLLTLSKLIQIIVKNVNG